MTVKKVLVLLTMWVMMAAAFAVNLHGKNELSGVNLAPPAPDKDGKIRILLYYDMEGVSGQFDGKSTSPGETYYDETRELLTDDVNAVIDGLFAGGADEVAVVDGHGSGNPEPDVLLDKMDKRAKMLYRNKPFRIYVDLVEKDIYDAVAVVCMHSKTGGGGFLAHTYNAGMEWLINGKSINETEIIAYSWGRADVPVIFATGDDKLAGELAYMKWLQYVTVKYAKGFSKAEVRPLDQVHQEMREKAAAAVKNLRQGKAMKVKVPVKAGLHAFSPASLGIFKDVPGIHYKDQVVTFEAQNFIEAYDGIISFLRRANLYGYMRLVWETVDKQPGKGKAMKDEIGNLFMKRWADRENGDYPPPEKKEDKKEEKKEKKKYFGAR